MAASFLRKCYYLVAQADQTLSYKTTLQFSESDRP